MIDVNGAGNQTTRVGESLPLGPGGRSSPAPRGGGSSSVVGSWGFKSPRGTRLGEMVLGSLLGGDGAAGGDKPRNHARHRRRHPRAPSRLPLRALVNSSSTGEAMTKRAPPVGDDSTQVSPCMTRTCSATSARPRPVPVPVPRRPDGRAPVEALEDLGPLDRVDARAASSTAISTTAWVYGPTCRCVPHRSLPFASADAHLRGPLHRAAFPQSPTRSSLRGRRDPSDRLRPRSRWPRRRSRRVLQQIGHDPFEPPFVHPDMERARAR